MTQHRVRAVYMRGGTSRCLCFNAEDLPRPGRERDAILLAALGSPDPYGRQLNGLGGGISSLSKACVIGPPSHPEADVDYTFGQVDVKSPLVHYTGNCGNCSSAIGPFAIDEKLVAAPADGEAVVKIHNTNTKKLIVAHVPVKDGEAAVDGDFELPGVPGKGARIALDFLDPGGAVTGRLLPTGRARDIVDGVEASLVDATNPLVFVRARDVGLTGAESPADVDADLRVSERLEKIRAAAARLMGIAPGPSSPKVAFVAPASAFTSLDGSAYAAADVDVLGRVISMGNCHRAFALTSAMCLAVAAQIEGTIVAECASPARTAGGLPKERRGSVRLGHPSGVLPVAAGVATRDGAPWAERVTVYRTARRLMEGFVRVP
ncbi:MAG: PrpF family protein [Candidatus Rokuibacteriota bacterium]|nr:MAG: PrpF family protein [Candidatus Rokubacteria bacterium]